MFVSKNRIRMHDIDMVGILYFPRQFRLVHESLEEFMEKEGYSFQKLFEKKEFLFVIVHCESNYLTPLHLGDDIEVHMYVEDIGRTSFTFCYNIYRKGEEVGTAKTVHVSISPETWKKRTIPESFLSILEKHKGMPSTNTISSK